LKKKDGKKPQKPGLNFFINSKSWLRTPLNAINGITHLLLQENPKESVALFILVKILRKLFSHLHQ
jgi:hypothetical protein